MKIGEEVVYYIKDHVEEMLDEEDYEYYIDEVALAIDPTAVHVYLYTKASKEVANYLVKCGLKYTVNFDNCQTMTYKSVLYVTLMTSKERYDIVHKENYKMASISLNCVVGWAKDRGYGEEEIINLLRKAALITC